MRYKQIVVPGGDREGLESSMQEGLWGPGRVQLVQFQQRGGMHGWGVERGAEGGAFTEEAVLGRACSAALPSPRHRISLCRRRGGTYV